MASASTSYFLLSPWYVLGEAAPLKITRMNEAWEKLTGGKLFVEATADMASDYRRFADVFSEIFGIMRDDWQWQPQDWLDIQGFLMDRPRQDRHRGA